MFYFGLILGMLGCGDSEEGFKVYNNEPTAMITSHADGEELLEAVTYTFVGQVGDSNHSTTDLKVVWSSNTQELCPESIPDADGTTICQQALTVDENQIKLTVTDPDGAAFVASIGVTIIETEAPTVELISPVVDGSYYSDQLILFSAVINDAEDVPAELSYVWNSTLDGDLPITTEPDSDGSMEAYASLSAGQHAISLRVEDTTGKSKTETVAITVGGPNSEPLCEITEPLTGETFTLGESISFAGTATDDDINNSLLSVSWASDLDGEFNTSSPLSDGSIAFSNSSLSAGNHAITLTVEDEVGGLCTAGVQLSVGTPPTLTLTSPNDGTLYTIGDAVSFEASVEDQEDLPSDITLSWISDIDGEFSTQGADSSGNISFSTSALGAGLHNLSVTATDSTGLTASTSLSIRINTPPPAPTVDIAPDPASTNDTLVATASADPDADGDNVTYTYEWFQNGNATTYNTASVPSSATAFEEVWTVKVTPNDGYTDGNFTEANITISNSAPSIVSVSISPGTVYNDDTVTCSAVATDADETLVPTYTWTVGTVTYTGSSLDLSSTGVMPDAVVTCTASVTDSGGEGAESSSSVTITNRDPVVGGTGIDPASVYTNTVVGCNASVSDDDGESLSATYEWFIGSSGIGSGSTLTLDNTLVSVGDSLICTATAEDGYGGTHSEDADVTVLNTEPTVDSVEIDLVSPTAVDTLTCSASANDIDGDTPTFAFSWSNLTTGDVYSSTSTSTASATLDLSSTSVSPSDEVECVVEVSDTDGGTATDIATVVIENTGPMFDVEASIDPSSGVVTGTELTCSASASDLDDGSLTVDYEWSVGASVIAAGDSYTVSASDTDVGDSITCRASVEDSDGETATSTATVSVENTAPVVSGVTITPSSAYNDDVLSCSATVSDPDETLSIGYAWSVGTTTLGTGASIDLSAHAVNPTDEVICTASATDDEGESDSASDSLTLDNRDPVLGSASIDNTAPYADSTMTCDVSVSDDDGESLTPSYAWMNGSASLGSGATLTLTPTTALVGDTITCTASVSDGYGGSDSTTTTASVQNSEPTMSTVSITPSSGVVITDTLTCSATGSDLNDGALTPSYEWYNQTNTSILGTSDTLVLDASTAGPLDNIQCSVSFSDSNGASVSDTSSVQITNTAPVFDTEASIDPNSGVFTDTTLTCDAVASDADDGSISVSYVWSVGSTTVATGAMYTVSA
ncbi:MAG: hypothetical protein VX278_19530, partial [Myxococcota bacterium]|nr:hypothetical protein [Myxococcota bacterium]